MIKTLIIILLGGILFLLLVGGGIFLTFNSVDYPTITIKDKERITEDDNSYYLIFTEEEVFKNTDALLFGKFDSSDVYNKLEIGKTYKVKVNWYRIPFLSAYRNIIKIEENKK